MAFGESTATYGGAPPPYQGICQGYGAGPTIWALISSMLFVILQTMCFSLNLVSSLSLIYICLVGFAFVDDTNLLHATQSPFTSESQIARK